MSPQLMLVLVGLFFILVFGGMSLLRREGLSIQFALEALAIILLVVLFGSALGVDADPIVLLILLYLVTLRARLLTDLANFLFKRRRYATAERLYRLALQLFPDPTSRFIVLVNWGVARFKAGDADGAIITFKDILSTASQQNGLGHKYEAACRYNLAAAYRRAGDDVNAVLQFNQVVDLFPASVYAQAAENALKKKRERSSPDEGL